MKTILRPVFLAYLLSVSGLNQVSADTLPNCLSASSDSDGDGYGWENLRSCLVVDIALNEPDNCEDRGDYPWGWDPVTRTSCLLAEPENAFSGSCIDSDGDGYGWNGTETCDPASSIQNPVTNLTAGLNIERIIFITTENEFRLTTRPLQKYPDGSTITYYIEGAPTDKDLQTVKTVLDELGDLTKLTFVQVFDLSATLDIHFAPVATFPFFIPDFVSEVGVTGTSQFYSNFQYVIFEARVAMDTAVSQSERDHATREELTHVLGFTNDTFDQFDSIFHQYPNGVTEYSESDRRVIATLYTTGLTAGMTPDQIRSFLAP